MALVMETLLIPLDATLSTVTVLCPGFQNGRVPSEIGIFSAVKRAQLMR